MHCLYSRCLTNLPSLVHYKNYGFSTFFVPLLLRLYAARQLEKFTEKKAFLLIEESF